MSRSPTASKISSSNPRARPARPQPRPPAADTVLFHKPFGVLSQFTGAPGQPTLAAFGLPPGIYAAGRLDADSEGLLLLTGNGPLIHRLLDPRFAHPRAYHAQVERLPTPESLATLQQGILLDGTPTRPCRARLLLPTPPHPERNPPIRFRKTVPTAWIEIVLTEGRNRQVRRMTAAIGHPTLRLIRVAIGALRLDGLAPGHWRSLTPAEEAALHAPALPTPAP